MREKEAAPPEVWTGGETAEGVGGEGGGSGTRFGEPGLGEWLIEDGDELIAGRRPVEEAFVARREARRLLIVPQRREALDALVLQATRLRIPVVEVEGGTLTRLAGFDGHQGVALVVAPRRWATLDDVLARAAADRQPPFVLVLDSLEDPQNMGTLLRSAEACGVHGVLFPVRNAAPLTPAAIKASAGAVEHLLLVPVEDMPGSLVDLRTRGLHVIGTDAEAPLSYRDADLRGPVALVVGSEGRGMTGGVRRRLELLVRIPMRGHVGSLNAAVAGSVLLFEAAAQRGGASTETGPTDRRHDQGESAGLERFEQVPEAAVPPERPEEPPEAAVPPERPEEPPEAAAGTLAEVDEGEAPREDTSARRRKPSVAGDAHPSDDGKPAVEGERAAEAREPAGGDEGRSPTRTRRPVKATEQAPESEPRRRTRARAIRPPAPEPGQAAAQNDVPEGLLPE